MVKCKKCNSMVEDGAKFCPVCGCNLDDSPKAVSSGISSGTDISDTGSSGSIVNSIKSDLSNSSTIKTIKSSAKNMKTELSNADSYTKKKIKTAAVIAAAVLAVLIIVTNIHVCDECEKPYFGKQYKVSFFGETEKLCKDCYDDVHNFEW